MGKMWLSREHMEVFCAKHSESGWQCQVLKGNRSKLSLESNYELESIGSLIFTA